MTKLKPWHLLSGAAVLLVALLLYARYERGRASEEIGKWRAVAKRLQQDSARAAKAIVKADTEYVSDTTALSAMERRYRLSRAEAQRLANLLKQLRGRDTVPVTVSVTDSSALAAAMRALTLADSTVLACREVVSTCEQRVAARDSLIKTLGAQRIADQRLAAARLRRVNPRITPYLEALVDPNGFTSGVGRAGLDIRILGPVRLAGALEVTRIPDHSDTRALVGVRVTF